MKVARTSNFKKLYKKLPKPLQKQVDKQIGFIEKDFFHPSLGTKRFTKLEEWWEFRVSKGYRMTGKKVDNMIVLHVVGPHDVGLGKK